MNTFALANANASVISVTSTATLLKTLIDTAGSTTHDYRTPLDAMDLIVEDGDIRILYDNNVPTASKGILLKQGTALLLRHTRIDQIRLISVSGTPVSCSVQIGTSTPDEVTALSNGIGSSSGTGGTTTPSSITNGTKNVAVTDTAVALAASAACSHVIVTARPGNQNPIVVGGSGVVATTASATGIILQPNEKVEIDIDDIAKVFINGTAGDGVAFCYS